MPQTGGIMKFYVLEQLINSQEIKSQGIDIDKMSEFFKIINKIFPKKTIEDFKEYNIIFLEIPFKLKNKTDNDYTNISKRLKFFLIKNNEKFELHNEKESYFCFIKNGLLKSFNNQDDCEKDFNNPIITENLLEKKALDWLENGRFGLSSGTICATLFPNLKNHYKLKDMYGSNETLKVNWPKDIDDFKRCMDFFDYIPEVKSRMKKLENLSIEWNELVDKWDQIKGLLKYGYEKESNTLLQQCLNSKVKKNKPF